MTYDTANDYSIRAAESVPARPNDHWRRPNYWATSGEDFTSLNFILLQLRDGVAFKKRLIEFGATCVGWVKS